MALISVQFSSNRNAATKNNLEIALPALDSGAITVICGKNHSGKTYIAKRIHRCIVKRNKKLNEETDVPIERNSVDNIYCEFSSKLEKIEPTVLITRIANITDLIKGTSVVIESNHKSRRYNTQRSDNYDRIQIKESLELFTLDCIKNHFQLNRKELEIQKWVDPNETEYRIDIMRSLDANSLFSTPSSNTIVQVFERLTQGRLYFGISIPTNNLPIFELHLAFSGNVIIPLGGWSEGQKVLLSLLLLIFYKKPSVLVFDEIENHLHPEYISAVLEFLKTNVKQTIITTHHPHIIFSKYVDCVNYLEIEKSSAQLADIIERKNGEQKAPTLKNQFLSQNYSKLLSTYKLFDSYDNQLLRIASSNFSNFNELLVDIFTSLFSYEVIGSTKKKKPDLQSQKLYELFENKMQSQNINVLEYGAGEGRMLLDINKILKTMEKSKINWTLYEPFEKHRKIIKESILNFPYKDQINVPESLPNDKFDFIIIPNVLHELTPNVIASILEYCVKSLSINGSIIIIELFPLLKPEKYAVPLSSYEWVNLARKLDFLATTENIVFKSAAHEAYFVSITPKSNKTYNAPDIEKKIFSFWKKEILSGRSGDYAGVLQLGGSEEIPKTLGRLSTIASIIAYDFCDWNSENN